MYVMFTVYLSLKATDNNGAVVVFEWILASMHYIVIFTMLALVPEFKVKGSPKNKGFVAIPPTLPLACQP